MAKIVLGAAVQDIRGSLNGSTYSRNKGGAYIRTKVSPVQPRTPAQLAQRGIFSLNAKAWSGTLTDAQRTAWTAFAAANPLTNVFGASITISGLAAYGQLNNVLGTVGSATITDPPVDKSVPDLAPATGISVDSGGSTVDIDTTLQTVVAGAKYYVFMTPPLAPGITPNQSVFRFIAAVASAAAALTVDVADAYNAKYGADGIVAGKKVWALVATVNTASGAVTIGQKFSTIVV